jgi:hypothetical protein
LLEKTKLMGRTDLGDIEHLVLLVRGDHPVAALARAVLFCGFVATLVLGVEVLVGSLLSASGY